MIKDDSFNAACLSNLLHDIETAFRCVRYHSLNEYNSYSVQFKHRLDSLSNALLLLKHDVIEFSENE